jgi:glycosyltransferase involved in cell wall biosynthesis
MHVMSKGPDSHTRLGVKVVEYLSCGLPVIVNSNVGGAAHVISVHDVGAVVDLGHPASIDRLRRLFQCAPAMRERCRAVAESEFSVAASAARWVALYRELGRAGG